MEDRIYVNFVTQPRRGKPAKLIRYYIRYQTFIDGQWKDVVEYDNCHDKVHRHDYDRNGRKGAAEILGRNDGPKRSFEDLKLEMTLLYEKYKQWYTQR